MRSYKRNESVIRFVKGISTEDVQAITLEISRKFELLANACDNKGLSTFPVNLVREIVELCNALKDKTPRYNIPASYVDYVKENKEVLGYFKSSLKDMLDEEAKIINKRKIFNLFRNMLCGMERF